LSYEPSNFSGKIAGSTFYPQKIRVEQAAWILFESSLSLERR